MAESLLPPLALAVFALNVAGLLIAYGVGYRRGLRDRRRHVR